MPRKISLRKQNGKLTVVFDYYKAMETYSRIGLLRSYGTLQSYWATTKLWNLTVVLDYQYLSWGNVTIIKVFNRYGLVGVTSDK